MKCFECGAKCLTVYLNTNGRLIISPHPDEKVTAVRKDCMNCEWVSYPTKVPSPIRTFDES